MNKLVHAHSDDLLIQLVSQKSYPFNFLFFTFVMQNEDDGNCECFVAVSSSARLWKLRETALWDVCGTHLLGRQSFRFLVCGEHAPDCKIVGASIMRIRVVLCCA